MIVQADASLRGLGACLIQQHSRKDQPIAFASKSLMDAEIQYANIERELLAIIFAYQHFSMYLLGRSFTAESDYKPLEMIAMKNLTNVPPHLRRMLLELQRYDVTIKYHSGAQVQLMETLSHGPGESLIRDQAGYEGRLHHLHEAMDWETRGHRAHRETPFPEQCTNSLSKAGRINKDMGTCNKEILGLQRWTLYQ